MSQNNDNRYANNTPVLPSRAEVWGIMLHDGVLCKACGRGYTECPGFNYNKIKNYTSATIKCFRHIDIFLNTGLHEAPYVLSRSQYGTISGTKHIKMIFIFSPRSGKNFIGKALCSSDDSIMQLIHILHFFTIKVVFFFQIPRRKIPDESDLKNEGSGKRSPCSCPRIRSWSRKSRKRPKWGGAETNWKIVLTGT
jgi:hypothetical protein